MTNPLVAFLTALQSDPALKARLQVALPDTADDVPAHVKAFASAEGYPVSDDDLAALATALERLHPQDGDDRILTDREVDAVSGGIIGPYVLLIGRTINAIKGNINDQYKGLNPLALNDVTRREFWLGF